MFLFWPPHERFFEGNAEQSRADKSFCSLESNPAFGITKVVVVVVR